MLDLMDSRELTAWSQFFLARAERDKAERDRDEWMRKNNFSDDGGDL